MLLCGADSGIDCFPGALCFRFYDLVDSTTVALDSPIALRDIQIDVVSCNDSWLGSCANWRFIRLVKLSFLEVRIQLLFPHPLDLIADL